MSTEAFVTLATNDGYALGALVVAQSLRKVGTQHPLVVLISKNVSDLIRLFFNKIEIKNKIIFI
jgi:glycogenin glucosyltransferase